MKQSASHSSYFGHIDPYQLYNYAENPNDTLGYNNNLFDKLHDKLMGYGECDGQNGCLYPYKSLDDDAYKIFFKKKTN